MKKITKTALMIFTLSSTLFLAGCPLNTSECFQGMPAHGTVILCWNDQPLFGSL